MSDGNYYGIRTGLDQPVAPEPKWSIPAILGLATPFLCLWIVGLPLAIVGILQTKGGARKGRGVAVAGLIVCVLQALIFVAAFLADPEAEDMGVNAGNAHEVADQLEREIDADIAVADR